MAVVNLERRAMNQQMTGAEAGRILLQYLEEFNPHGPVSTWRPLRRRRKILELQSVWKRSCENQGLPCTQRHWSLNVRNKEGGEVVVVVKISDR